MKTGLRGHCFPSLEYTPEKRIDSVGISCYNKNTGTKKVLKRSAPILGCLLPQIPNVPHILSY